MHFSFHYYLLNIFILSFCLLQNAYPLRISSGSDVSRDTSDNQKTGDKPRTYTTLRLSTGKPVIDGELDDPCWETGDWSGDFIQFIPHEGAPPSLPTELKILYDDKSLYVAIRAYDSIPEKIQRYAGMRDEFTGDIVGINFDSYHDHRTGFEFDLTAYGQKIDLVLTNPMAWDASWNPVWKGKEGFEDSAWVAEMEIPLSQLRYSKENEQVWGFQINLIGHTQELDTRILRGGYDMVLPGGFMSFGGINTDQSKRVSAGLEYDYQCKGNQSANSYSIGPGISIRPFNTLKIRMSANYAENYDQLQYITTQKLSTGDRTGNAEPITASPGESFGQLWKVFPGNIFLIKFNYWFSL